MKLKFTALAMPLALSLMLSLALVSSAQSNDAKPTAQKALSNPSLTISDKINVNTAPMHQLVKLKGIGKAKATAIIDYRSEHGKFESIEALAKVPGIGQRLIEQNRALISL